MKIEWTEPAIADLQHIRDYIAKDSEYYAARFAERIISRIDILPDFPEMGRLVMEADDKSIRELIYQKISNNVSSGKGTHTHFSNNSWW